MAKLVEPSSSKLPTVNPGTLGELDQLLRVFGVEQMTCTTQIANEPDRWRVELGCGLAVGFGATISEAINDALNEWIAKEPS